MENPFDDPALVAGYEAWYDTEGRVANQLERGLLGWLLDDFSGVESVLEIGTGTGHFARWLKGLNWRVVGLDTSASMLAEAVRRDGLPYVRADAGALPFADRIFDVALMVTTLEFLPDPILALREAARVVRCGIVFGVLNRWHPLARQRRRSGVPLWQAAHFYSLPELRNVRRALGTDR
jgi:ubiquinone/menaquinone biosynthesis C-methylase UbiE